MENFRVYVFFVGLCLILYSQIEWAMVCTVLSVYFINKGKNEKK